MSSALDKAIEEFVRLDKLYLDHIDLQHNIKFSVFTILLFFISIAIWLNMLDSLNTDIFRAKGVFNILPTYLLSANADLIKDISEASIFT